MIGHPYEKDFKSMVSNNMIKKCPITSSGVINAPTMFGPNLSGNRGNTIRHKPDRVVMDYLAVPKCFLKLHRFVTLLEYLMFVSDAPFLITMSRGIKFVTV